MSYKVLDVCRFVINYSRRHTKMKLEQSKKFNNTKCIDYTAKKFYCIKEV